MDNRKPKNMRSSRKAQIITILVREGYLPMFESTYLANLIEDIIEGDRHGS